MKVPEMIKRVTKHDLVSLSGKARNLHLTGRGREAERLAEHLPDGATGVLRALLPEPHPQLSYRCFVVIQRTRETLDHFPLDILPRDFEQLPDLTGEELVRLTRWALFQIPIQPEGTPATLKMPTLRGQSPSDP
ncbi:hypothetical protein [Actinoallomurus vinaceus]|uniref:hypothetical protein n=1 Tax=Actinoallomurus vinaceus TaxID=1080074 RepID=UPI0031E6A382